MSAIVDLLGLEILPEEHAILNHPNTSGVLLFARNIGPTREAILSLVDSIHAARPELIVFIDQEGGNVVRISRRGFRSIPAAHVYGDAYDINSDAGLKLARKYGEMMAHDLLTCAIDVSLAPVLDVHGPSTIIGGLDRAFHADPNIVTALGGAFIEGMHAAGMPAVGKHFPGHGTCVADSHLAMPIDTRTRDELLMHDLKPFISLIKSKHLDGVMPAHITFPAIDPNYATGFSSYWLKTILREQLKFEGIIISDCLGMTGADIGSLLERSIHALEAGCDLLIAANQPRDRLLDCLNQLPTSIHQENTLYIEQFKQSMLRFTEPDKTQSMRALSQAQPETIELSNPSNINLTKTI
ncbi:MAG: beta-N-acetylhexosaminidase [Legionella sp.]|jgi:beta-N-acetylhexosaminidase|nr:beta-N-acetylhexosaminidase [Legionella sp.]